MERRRWQRRKDARPGEILAAARELFAAGGRGVPMIRVAEKCGITKGTIYLYFPTKAELWTAATGTEWEPPCEA